MASDATTDAQLRAEDGASSQLDADFEGEIRIEQSVHLVGQMPTLVIGNCLGVLIGVLLTVEHVGWPRIAAWAWLVLLTVPMAINWLKLRKKPRPTRVSRRRIRVAGWSSLVLGLSWAAVVPVFLPQVPMINQACLIFGVIGLAIGAVASISALPFSAMAYFVPMMSMAFWVTAANPGLPYKPLAVLSGLLFVAQFGFLRQNWRTFRRNVAIAVERTHLAEMQRREMERRAAAERELREAKDAAIRAAEEVRKAQKRVQSIIEALPLPVAIFRLRDARTVYANKWAAELMGLEIAQMLERTSAQFFPEPGEEQQVLNRLEGEHMVVDYETTLRRADGTDVPVRLAAILMEYEGEKAILAVTEDITQRKRHEEELEIARTRAEEANLAKSRFLANMSHELRTPLNAVLGYTELMADGIYGTLPEKAASVLARVQSNGQHLLGLINDVLDLSKIEAGQLELHAEPYHWQSIVNSVVAATESLAQAKDLELRTDIAADLPAGVGDERRLTQVVLNLVGNAVKFTETGHVAVAARRDGANFLVTVSDTGPGIDPQDQARIFEEFQQADNSDTRKKGGTGLGLAISRRIVEMHGGRLVVRSTPGEGASFDLEIPIETSPQNEAAT